MAEAMVALARAIRDRRVIPPAPGNREMIGGKELIEPVLVQPDASAATSCFIEYVDREGQASERLITFQAIEGDFGDPRWIVAYCHLRRDYRRFLIDGIVAMVDLDGRALDPRQTIVELQLVAAEDENVARLVRAMIVPIFVARVDGDFHALEKDTIVQLLGEYLARFDSGEAGRLAREKQVVDPELARRVIGLAPSGDHVLHAIEALAGERQGAAIADFIIDALDRIVDADERQSDEELEWFAVLVEALMEAGQRAR